MKVSVWVGQRVTWFGTVRLIGMRVSVNEAHRHHTQTHTDTQSDALRLGITA